MLYNLGLGGAVALLPWAGPLLDRFEPRRLSARIALVLAGSVTLPLIISVAVLTRQEEQAASDQALTGQQILATALAQNIASYVGLHRGAVEALATFPGLATSDPPAQQAQLERFSQIYPDMTSFAIYDTGGELLASSAERQPAPSIRGLQVFEQARHERRPSIEIRQSRSLDRPVFAFGVPLQSTDGGFAGVVVGALESARVFYHLDLASSGLEATAYLVDGAGRIIAHPDDTLVAAFTPYDKHPPVAALLEQGRVGAQSYFDHSGLQLAAYAPVNDLGWGVLIERPANEALRSVYARRDRDFVSLLLLLIGLLVVSAAVARWLATPLASFARAAGQLATGDDQVPLPQSRIVEVAETAAAFGAMRNRLAARTAERDRVSDQLQTLAEAGSVLSASLDYELTLRNVARLVVTSLADYCVIDIIDDRTDRPQIERVAAAHRDPAKEPLVQALCAYPPRLDGEGRLIAAIRSGRPELIPRLDPATLTQLSRNPEHLELIHQLAPTSMIAAPLIARDRSFGALTLARSDPTHPYAAEDLNLAVELARRAALALDNARLYREAQVAVSLREQFLSVASHELKTPLTALLGNAQLLQRRLSGLAATTEREQRTLGHIVGQATRLDRMIGTLLDISRIQAGRLVLEPQRFDLCLLIRRVIDEIQPTLDRHQISFRAHQKTLLLDGDELRLEQVLQNLLANAVKYSPQGGEVRVEAEGCDGWVRVAIRDQGIGIPPEARSNLFGRFYRAPNTQNTGISGMGIGLFIVHEIVSLHGGRIEVESTVGSGSTFTVWLPLGKNL